MPWKIEFPWNFSLHWNIIIFQVFWATCACPENKFVMKIFAVFNILFTFRMFEQLLLDLRNRVCPEFTALNVLLSFRILNNLRLPWKQNLPWNFSLQWNVFYLSGSLSNLNLPWKQSLPWISEAGEEPGLKNSPSRVLRHCLCPSNSVNFIVSN